MKKKCPFCDKDIIKKQLVFETENEYVISNIRPATKGQCLVIPKNHVSNIRDLSKNQTETLLKTVRAVSIKIKKNLKPNGFNYGFNESPVAGQAINHLHFHILPRYKKDGLPEYHLFHRDNKKRNLKDGDLEKVVQDLRKVLK